MHQDYRDAKIKELRDQQARWRQKKVEQAALAEKLLGEIAKDRNYSFDYVCFRVTNYRPDSASRHNIASEDLGA